MSAFRVTVSRSTGRGPQRGLEVFPCKGGWHIQPWTRTEHGRRYDDPIAGPFKTKKEANAARKTLLESGNQ